MNQLPFAALVIVLMINIPFCIYKVTAWVRLNTALKLELFRVHTSDDSKLF